MKKIATLAVVLAGLVGSQGLAHAQDGVLEKDGYFVKTDAVGIMVYDGVEVDVEIDPVSVVFRSAVQSSEDPKYRKSSDLDVALERCLSVRANVLENLEKTFLIFKATCKARKLTPAQFAKNVEGLKNMRSSNLYWDVQKKDWTDYGKREVELFNQAATYAVYHLEIRFTYKTPAPHAQK